MIVSQAKATAGWDLRWTTTGSMTSRTSHSRQKITSDQDGTGHLWDYTLPSEHLDLLVLVPVPVQPGRGAVGQPPRVDDERMADPLQPAALGRARGQAQAGVVAVDEVAAGRNQNRFRAATDSTSFRAGSFQ